ncbi:MAG: DUF58 domain-containing protein [Planctomycetota bacterium]
MQVPMVKPPEARKPAGAGVYAELDDLIRLQFKARGFSFLPKQPVQSLLAGRRASRLRGRGLDFEEIRRYRPGDDIRTMDWRVTARLGKPHIRVHTEEKDRPVLLVVDQRLSMFFGSRVAMKSVTAAETAALGAWRAFGVGDRVGALLFNDSEIREIPPHRSRQRVMQILQAVVKMNHALRTDGELQPNPAMLNRVLERVLHLAKKDHLVGIVSDFSGADQDTRSLVTRMTAHNDVLALFIYDPLEANLPAAGKLIVSEGDLQLEVDTRDAELRTRFSEQFSTRLKTARDLMLKRSVPLLPIHTTARVREQMRELLGHSSRASRKSSGAHVES